MNKLKGKQTKSPSPFEMKTHKTEQTAVAILMHWMREIIEKKNLDLGMPDVETSGTDRKRPDTVIYESRRSQNVLCVVEAKQPFFDVYDETLKDDARKKANKRGARYFVTTNFKKLIWWKTQEANNPSIPEPKQIVDTYYLSEIENLDDIEQIRYTEPIKRKLEEFLTKLYAIYSGKEPEPKKAIDELLIFTLHEKIRVLSTYYRRIIDDQCHKDTVFAKKLKNWFLEQGWGFAWQPQDFDKAARQTAYLLVNKILFYNLLQTKRPGELDPLEIPEGLTKGAMLQTTLQGYFNQILKIDYETIYTADFIDTTAFPEAKEVVREIKEIVNIFKKYDFSTLGYDVLGRIFERLIPQDERHNLGQYFTSPDVVDLILRFCLQHEDDKILDPACGAGTFLVRAYQHKKLMNQRLGHERILNTLWGNDIAKFPATLATINLAINDLGVDKNYPNILQEDFFALLVGREGFDPDKWRKARAKTLRLEEREVTYPRWFDAIVGNPPYTRQEEIAEISPEDIEYKEKLIKKALLDLQGKKVAEIGKRAGIHAYFFVHGTKFLQEGGHFGFIVSNSWLDVDYGKGLQEFFLKNYKIIAIIESKVERWFEAADINTCIVILQKYNDKKERDENIVRFVYLKKKLRDFIPPAQDMWEKQVERLNAIDKLKKTILAHNNLYENEELRIFPKSQKELWDEGFDPEEDKYTGAKWGKYLRAPEIFFKILEKGKGKLVPLKKVAKVRFGIKTGANEFFYLTEEEIKRKGIEKEFWMHKDKKGKWVPNYVIEKAKESEKPEIELKTLKKRVLFLGEDFDRNKAKSILSHIKNGERKRYNERPTCASRKPGREWYNLGENVNDIIAFPERVRLRHIVFYNPQRVSLNKNLYGIKPKHIAIAKTLAVILNSTLIPLYLELFSRQPGGGGGPLDIDVYVSQDILVPGIALLKKYKIRILKENILKRKIGSIFSELGTSSSELLSLDKVKPDRRELDRIIMSEILGLTDEEQLEVYRAVVDLVKSRIEKAKSVGANNKIIEGVNIYGIKRVVMGNLLRDGE
jgi:type I restriction-modification system DNA methylase subunit